MPVLLRLNRPKTIRDDVLATIEQIVGIEDLARVVRTTTDPKVRAALMLRLLTTGSEPGLLGYLSLIRDDATRLEALAVSDKAPQLPIGALLVLLDQNEKWVGFAAALVLGHANGPEVTKLLIARVTEKPANSMETWMALLACRGELAEDFLSYAALRPQLLGHFNSARVRWAQLIP